MSKTINLGSDNYMSVLGGVRVGLDELKTMVEEMQGQFESTTKQMRGMSVGANVAVTFEWMDRMNALLKVLAHTKLYFTEGNNQVIVSPAISKIPAEATKVTNTEEVKAPCTCQGSGEVKPKTGKLTRRIARLERTCAAICEALDKITEDQNTLLEMMSETKNNPTRGSLRM